MDLQQIGQTKIKILLLFTQSHVFPNLYAFLCSLWTHTHTHKDIWKTFEYKELVTKQFQFPLTSIVLTKNTVEVKGNRNGLVWSLVDITLIYII